MKGSTPEKSNISKYSKFKTLYKLNKEKSPYEIVFLCGEPDGWFIDVIWYKKKSGEISHHSLIIEKDVKNWLDFQESLGWKILTDF